MFVSVAMISDGSKPGILHRYYDRFESDHLETKFLMRKMTVIAAIILEILEKIKVSFLVMSPLFPGCL